MKSFKAMMAEVAQPEPPEEKAFKAQHKVEVKNHPVAPETQFKGTKPKAKNKADQEGDANYDLAYESVDLEEMKVKNSDAAFKLETEISNLEKRIEKLKPLATKDDDANMKLGIARKSLKQKQDAHSALMRESADLTEQPQEEIPMMMNQLAFICYAAEEISGMLKLNSDPEEWFQNKLAATHSEMKTLYSYMQGQNQMDYMNMGYADDMDEALSPKQKKIDHNKNNRIDGEDLAMIRAKKSVKEELKGDQHKIDKNKNGKIDKHDFKLLNKEEVEQVDEAQSHQAKTTMKHIKNPTAGEKKAAKDIKPGIAGVADRLDMLASAKARGALKKESAYEKDMDDKKKVVVKGVKGMKSTPFTRTFRNMAAYDKWSDSEEAGNHEVHQVMHEEVELDEAFKVGIVKLKDNSSMVLKKEDADILNKLMSGMSAGSVKKMTETAMKDKTGFAEILAFAKEAM